MNEQETAKFMDTIREINERLDKLDEALVEEKIALFSIGIELEELKAKLDEL